MKDKILNDVLGMDYDNYRNYVMINDNYKLFLELGMLYRIDNRYRFLSKQYFELFKRNLKFKKILKDN